MARLQQFWRGIFTTLALKEPGFQRAIFLFEACFGALSDPMQWASVTGVCGFTAERLLALEAQWNEAIKGVRRGSPKRAQIIESMIRYLLTAVVTMKGVHGQPYSTVLPDSFPSFAMWLELPGVKVKETGSDS